MKNRISLMKIVDSIFVVLFLLFFIFIFIDIRNISKTLKETQKEKIELLINSQKSIYSSLLYFGFDYELKKSLEELVKKNEVIKGVELKSPKLLFKYPKNFKDNKFLNFELKYKDKKLGVLKVYYDTSKILKSFFTKYFHRFVLYLLFIFPLILLLWIYIRKRIKSLHILAKKTEKINFKKTDKIGEIDNYMEILLIINSLNKLLRQVNNFYISQKNTIKKLIKYKKQLQNAQKVAKMASWEFECESQTFESLFKNFYGYKSIEEILKSADDGDLIIKKIKDVCEECRSLEFIKKVGNYYLKIDAQCMKRGGKKVIIGTVIDITEEIRKQERIEYLAYHDTLTGVTNRAFLKEELQCLVNFAKRNSIKFAIIYLDLDNFKIINDSYGHETGDKVLIEVTKRLKNIIRKSDILARIGGDEFVIVLNNIKEKKDVECVVKKIFESLKKPVIVNDKKFDLTFSVGIAVYPIDSEDVETLFKYADIAMYKAKKEGKNRYVFIDEKLKEEIKSFYEMRNEIKEGLERGEFELYLQPQVDVIGKKVFGAEALIRWNHPKKGVLSPNVFIPVAEDGSLIYLIDDFVLNEAFKILKKWQKDDLLKNLKLSINISAREFKTGNFIDKLKKLIQQYKIDPSKLEIEITETVSMENVTYTIETLQKIKKLGFGISIDDFGTGYSSLNYLKMLPFDIIKIDRSFIKEIIKDEDDYLITKMIIEVSKILNKENIAEGVETKEVLEKIKELGCRYVQGYYFSKPLKEEDFYKFVRDFHA